MDNKTKPIVFTILLLTVSILFSMQFVDRPLALALDGHLRGTKLLLSQIVYGLEWISGFKISKYLLGIVIVSIGVVLYLARLTREISKYFLYIGATHLLSRLAAGTLKNVFLRTRPYEFLENQETRDFFVEGGNSFPSGDVAHFFSLFIPLLFIWPRSWFLILFVPSVVAMQRVISNDHYLSDALTSILIAYMFTLAFLKLFQRRAVWKHSQQ